ncbi:MAG: hypothetical protein KAT48_03665 [Bacteroidales bacterium]|nr:hypothetical protein [Bacteroidales bacterium]
MKKYFRFQSIIISFLILGSCSTDIDMIAEWKDITVVYSLLNQTDSISYVKVNKAFLGDTNALYMAQEPDSSSYGDALTVQMEQWKWGGVIRTFDFDTTTIYNKEPGIFYNPEQVIYQSVTHDQFDEESEYKLIITNQNTGKVITAQTSLVHDFMILKPPLNHPTHPTIMFPDNSFAKDVEWVSAKNGRRYEVIMRFNYKEKLFTNPDTLFKSVDYPFTTRRSKTTEGGENMLIQFANENFYIFLQSAIPYEPEMEAEVDSRVSMKVDFLYSVAGEEFNTYMVVNEPSNSIIQDRPEYTNIINGIGIFSCRYNKSRSYSLHPLSQEILTTKGLKFVMVIGG